MPVSKTFPDRVHAAIGALLRRSSSATTDTEWGFPVADDQRLFEKLSLEGFQSGLSWRTILVKRENFRACFAQFDLRAVARFGKRDVTRLLADEGIVRHRGKIEAVINNAQRALELIDQEGSLAAYFWRHEPDAKHLGNRKRNPARQLQSCCRKT